jgi:hypothetical protein
MIFESGLPSGLHLIIASSGFDLSLNRGQYDNGLRRVVHILRALIASTSKRYLARPISLIRYGQNQYN